MSRINGVERFALIKLADRVACVDLRVDARWGQRKRPNLHITLDCADHRPASRGCLGVELPRAVNDDGVAAPVEATHDLFAPKNLICNRLGALVRRGLCGVNKHINHLVIASEIAQLGYVVLFRFRGHERGKNCFARIGAGALVRVADALVCVEPVWAYRPSVAAAIRKNIDAALADGDFASFHFYLLPLIPEARWDRRSHNRNILPHFEGVNYFSPIKLNIFNRGTHVYKSLFLRLVSMGRSVVRLAAG